MKVDLDEKGQVRIKAENGVEGYALRKWFDENKNEPINKIEFSFSPYNSILKDGNKNKT